MAADDSGVLTWLMDGTGAEGLFWVMEETGVVPLYLGAIEKAGVDVLTWCVDGGNVG
jgi:hypothetical protein